MARINRAFNILNRMHNKVAYRRRISVLSEQISSVVPASQSVLDVGSGSGLLAQAIQSMRKDLTIHGVDVRLSNETDMPMSLYDGTKFPFCDGSWDMVMAVDVLHHSEEPMETLREMCRVSKRYILIKDHVADNRVDFGLLQLMDWLGNRGYGTPLPYNYYSYKEWMAAFRQLQLEIVYLKRSLHIYPPPISWLLDRNLHFLVLLRVT